MWTAVLVGIGAGLLVAIYVIAKQERRYRVLFSDTHLGDFARALEKARTGAPSSTFEGLTLGWERLPQHIAITVESKGALAPPAARFVLSYVRELVGVEMSQALNTGKQRWAALFQREALDGERQIAEPTTEDITTSRQRAADAMRELTLVEGSLTAFR